MYIMVPYVLRNASALVLNLSMLASDFYVAIFAYFLFHSHFSALYLLGFSLVVSGLFGYAVVAA
jgi:drug/metabolite transporter (DMT)-like permease